MSTTNNPHIIVHEHETPFTIKTTFRTKTNGSYYCIQTGQITKKPTRYRMQRFAQCLNRERQAHKAFIEQLRRNGVHIQVYY